MELSMIDASIEAWAEHTFGKAELRDKRRTRRLVKMAQQIATKPAGNVTNVFTTSADREAAYRFVENTDVDPEAIVKGMRFAVVERCSNEPFVFVAIDGSSVTLADHFRKKDYGSIGPRKLGARGLKVMAALAVSSEGTPIGLTSLQMWSRGEKNKVHRNKRALAEKETKFAAEAAVATAKGFDEKQSSCRVWFQVDREHDAEQLLETYSSTNHLYTVRAKANRRIKTENGKTQYVRDVIAQKKTHQGTFTLDIPAGHKRSARTAMMSVRAAKVTLLLRDQRTERIREFETHVVYAFESSYVPEGEQRLEWLLYTNHPIETNEDLALILFGYTQRWRVEDFFRAWKTTGCHVEEAQLHSAHSIRIWGTMLAATAARIERLKHLSRTQPNLPASVEFTEFELEALVMLKKARKKRTEQIPEGVPTIEEAVRWVAELGGYTGKSSGGPPGSVVIRRGLEPLRIAAEVVKLMRSSEKKM
jgi:Transposase DNA-binding/Transposase Tn5 dimerisation domain